MSEMPEDLDGMLNRPVGESTSERHPTLAAVGGVSLIFGVLASAVWLLVVVFTGADFSSWTFAPFLAGGLVFLLTALVAVTIDKGRGH